jgi:hypothetical protein
MLTWLSRTTHTTFFSHRALWSLLESYRGWRCRMRDTWRNELPRLAKVQWREGVIVRCGSSFIKYAKYSLLPSKVAERSKALVCGRSLLWIVGSNGGVGVHAQISRSKWCIHDRHCGCCCRCSVVLTSVALMSIAQITTFGQLTGDVRRVK